MSKISVLMTTEGTYPFHQGGVSTWCDMLIKQLRAVDFTVFAVMTDPFVTQKFNTGRLAKVIRVPLWGTEEPSEHLDKAFSSTYLAKQRTTDKVVEEQFLPLFDRLVAETIAIDKNAFEFADVIVNLYDFFTEYDYKICFKSPMTWNRYNKLILNAAKQPDWRLSTPDVFCMIQSLGWLYRFFNIINTPIPKTTITHSSAAAFCGLPCIISKVKYGTPFLLTEHGVYLREQYLSLSKHGYPSFLNTYLIRMIHSIVTVNYTFADQISPVCYYNTRWEKRWTDRHHRIKVIYNGVDDAMFNSIVPKIQDTPTVVTVARIDPIKDFLTLLRSADRVRKKIPNVRFLIYGSVTVQEYYDRCLNLRSELNLDQVVEFCGHITDVSKAYEKADIVLQTSISEAFPYSVIEAMLASRSVISTDVGGIPEAIGDTGMLVAPGDDSAIAESIIHLFSNPEARLELGAQARQRALSLFTLEDSLTQYLRAYIMLSVAAKEWGTEATVPPLLPGHDDMTLPGASSQEVQQLYAERAYALRDYGFSEEAAVQFEHAIEVDPNGQSVPVFLVDLARIYQDLGEDDKALSYMIKHAMSRAVLDSEGSGVR